MIYTNYTIASKLGELLLHHKLHCVAAESCTGGGVSAAITDIPGSSQWFDCSFVTYSNKSKQQMLGVPEQVIASYGAVSEPVVRAMAEGALAVSRTNISVAISGVAGPDGGSPEKPVGTVWFAWASDSSPTRAQCYLLLGDRLAIRQQAVKIALEGLIQTVRLTDTGKPKIA